MKGKRRRQRRFSEFFCCWCTQNTLLASGCAHHHHKTVGTKEAATKEGKVLRTPAPTRSRTTTRATSSSWSAAFVPYARRKRSIPKAFAHLLTCSASKLPPLFLSAHLSHPSLLHPFVGLRNASPPPPPPAARSGVAVLDGVHAAARKGAQGATA
jgi:hypothetical protein